MVKNGYANAAPYYVCGYTASLVKYYIVLWDPTTLCGSDTLKLTSSSVTTPIFGALTAGPLYDSPSTQNYEHGASLSASDRHPWAPVRYFSRIVQTSVYVSANRTHFGMQNYSFRVSLHA